MKSRPCIRNNRVSHQKSLNWAIPIRLRWKMAKVEIDFSPRFVRLQWGRRARPQCLQPRQYGGNNLEGVYCVEVHGIWAGCSNSSWTQIWIEKLLVQTCELADTIPKWSFRNHQVWQVAIGLAGLKVLKWGIPKRYQWLQAVFQPVCVPHTAQERQLRRLRGTVLCFRKADKSLKSCTTFPNS